MARVGLFLVAALLLMLAASGCAHPIAVRSTAGGVSGRSTSRTSDIIPDQYILILVKTCDERCQRKVKSGLERLGCTKINIHRTVRMADARCPKRKGVSPLCAMAALPGVEHVEPDGYYYTQ